MLPILKSHLCTHMYMDISNWTWGIYRIGHEFEIRGRRSWRGMEGLYDQNALYSHEILKAKGEP